jgi:hypothetical protein
MESETGTAARRKPDWGWLVLLGVIGAGVSAVLWAIWPPKNAGSMSDAVEYLVLAGYLRDHGFAGESGTDGFAVYYGQTRLPLGYPAVLALFGAGPDAIQRALLVTAGCAIAAALAIARWYRRERGGYDAALLLACATLNIGFVSLATEPMAEAMFIAASLFAISELSRDASPSRELRAAAAIAVMPLIRAAGVIHVGAFVVWLLLARPGTSWRRRAALAALACGPALIAYALRARGADSYADYFTAEGFAAAFGGGASWIIGQPLRLLEGLALGFARPAAPVEVVAMGLLAAVAVYGWTIRLKRGAYDAVLVVPYVAALFVWPFPLELPRLWLPLVPIIVLFVSFGAERLALRARAPALGRVVPAVFLALSVPTLVVATARSVAPMPPERFRFARDIAYLTAPDEAEAASYLAANAGALALIASLPAHVAPGRCVYAFGALHTWLYSRVEAIALPRELDLASPIAPQLPACDHVVVTGLGTNYHRYTGNALFHALVANHEIVAIEYLDAPGRPAAAALVRLRRE